MAGRGEQASTAWLAGVIGLRIGWVEVGVGGGGGRLGCELLPPDPYPLGSGQKLLLKLVASAYWYY